MSIFYHYQLTKDIQKADESKERARKSLQPFYQYLDKTKQALENRTVDASWEKVGGIRIRLMPVSFFYRITPITKIKIDQNNNLYLVKSDQNIETDFNSMLKIRETKSSIPLTPEKIKKEENQLFIEMPDEFSSFTILSVNWGFESFQLEKIASSFSEIKEIKQKGFVYRFEKESDGFNIYGIVDKRELLEIDGRKIRYSVLSEFNEAYLKGKNYFTEKQSFIIITDQEFSEKPSEVTIEKVKFDSHWLDNYSDFFAANGDSVLLECSDEIKLQFILYSETSNLQSIYSKNPKIKFQVNTQNADESEKYWIQLSEMEENERDDEINSPLEYFFDDEVDIQEIVNGKKTNSKFRIVKGKSEEKRIVLMENGKFVFPKPNTILRANRNTYQIYKQIQAIQNLQNKPSLFHENLLKLFEDRESVDWKPSYSEFLALNWKILINDSYSGVERQREFVKKALTTPDFAIMEGPPGSGKTTVILELIWQILSQGKRVLLCGSTHVAIDNILERIKEKELLDTIFPIRIGDVNRISEQIKEFSLDEIKVKYKNISETLLLESANLVCGTIIGILQHPFLKDIKPNSSIVPEFDYLIIDESSKTTFQEFLVPAMYAKRWIIVGDVKQLSPFTDQMQITTNLENMELENSKQLSRELQRVCLILQTLHPLNQCKFIIPLSKVEIQELHKELLIRLKDNTLNAKLLIISPSPIFKNSQIENVNEQEFINTAIFYINYNLIFVDQSLVDHLIPYFPDTMIFLFKEDWKQSMHAFKYNAHNKSFNFKVDRIILNDSFEISNALNIFFREKSWASELGWRLNRTYEKRLLKKKEDKIDYLQKQIDELLPRSIDIKAKLETIRAIAFPSVLEGLVKGIKDRWVQTLTTLTSGFKKRELFDRHIVLDYQHRMHPEISLFPRERFYSDKDELGKEKRVLLDGQGMKEKREWDYPRYKNRKIWMHVEGKLIGKCNRNEVERVMKEIEFFISWAKDKHPLNNQNLWEVAVLTFYRKQEKELKIRLREYCKLLKSESRFFKENCIIKLHTVDKFQGQEADIVFLSMVQNQTDGFMDSPNRLNVGITRARYQLVIVGDYGYFSQSGKNKTRSEDLAELAKTTTRMD